MTTTATRTTFAKLTSSIALATSATRSSTTGLQPMHHAISLTVLAVALLVLRAGPTARMAAAGQWGEALGRFVIAPVVVFLIAQAVLFYGWRLVRGDRGRTFATSRLNYVSLAIVLLSILGQIGKEAAERMP